MILGFGVFIGLTVVRAEDVQYPGKKEVSQFSCVPFGFVPVGLDH